MKDRFTRFFCLSYRVRVKMLMADNFHAKLFLYEIWNFSISFETDVKKMKKLFLPSKCKNRWKISHLRIKAAYCASVLCACGRKNKKVSLPVNAKLCGFLLFLYWGGKKSFILILLSLNKHILNLELFSNIPLPLSLEDCPLPFIPKLAYIKICWNNFKNIFFSSLHKG